MTLPGSREVSARGESRLGVPSMLGPIHAFGSGCFFLFGLIYLVVVHSPYMSASNAVFGTLGTLHWFLVPRSVPHHVRAAGFLAIVYVGLINVATHLGTGVLPMVFWGMSVTIAAAFLHDRAGVIAWSVLTLLYYPLVHALKTGPFADRVIPLDPLQDELLTWATYAGLLSFLAYTFFLFRSRLAAALDVLRTHADALAESEAFLAQSQQVARVGSFDLSVAAGEWTASTVLDEILGIDASYPRDIPRWLALIHAEDRDDWRRFLAADPAMHVLDGQYRLARHDQGEAVWVHGRGVVHRGPDGLPQRLMGTIQDISEFRRAERARRSLEARLFQAQKLESLGVLAGGVAHDFNNLLTVVLGNLNLAICHENAQRPDLALRLQHAETAALRAAELTRQMLAFSGGVQFAVEPLDLDAVFTELSGRLRSTVPGRIEVRRVRSAPGPRVVADATQIREVIENLILNAVEAIGDATGVITVRIDLRDTIVTPLVFAPPEMAPGPYATIEVTDTGSGIDPAIQARVFEPFFSTRFAGRGLGLAAVLGIVKGHHGAIALTSTPGQGTTFTLMFPCAPTET